MFSVSELQDLELLREAFLAGMSALCVVLAILAIVLWQKLRRTREGLSLLIQRIDAAIGTKSAGFADAAASLDEYVTLSGKVVAQLRERQQDGAAASTVQPDDGGRVTELDRAIRSVGELSNLLPGVRATDWTALRDVMKIEEGLATTRGALERLDGQPLRNEVVDEAVREGAFDVSLSLPSLLRAFFPELYDDAIGRSALALRDAVQDLLAIVGISIHRVEPLEYVAITDSHMDYDGDRWGLRRVQAIRSRVAKAKEPAEDKVLVIDCSQPGYWRDEHVIRPMKMTIFKRAEWAVPTGQGI